MERKNNRLIQRYLLDGLSAMAMGLFASLIIGLILKTTGEQLMGINGYRGIASVLIEVGQTAMSLMGAAIGVAVAMKFVAPFLVVIASVVTGTIGAIYGGPAGAYLAVVIGIAVGELISKKTPLDIMITPALTILFGYIMAITGGQIVGLLMSGLGVIIGEATIAQPFIMGVVISLVMGLALTAPISSAALALMLGLSSLAAGAATAGCCAHMIGFSLMSRKDNSLGLTLAQGLGTSMLQIANIIKNPWILLPPVLTSMIVGPLATVVFKMENVAAGAGMGTSGLVGPILTFSTMGFTSEVLLKVVFLYFAFPAILSILFYEILVKKGFIKKNDCKIIEQ